MSDKRVFQVGSRSLIIGTMEGYNDESLNGRIYVDLSANELWAEATGKTAIEALIALSGRLHLAASAITDWRTNALKEGILS